MRKGWPAALLVAGAMALAAGPAYAQPADPQARSAARALSEEGDKLWDQGEWASALDRFSRAHALVAAPPLAVRQAECLEKLGRLVEASERYLEISRLSLAPDASDLFREAVSSSGPKAQALRERLPMLEVAIAGEAPPEALLSVDGKPVPRELWGVKWPVDPGERIVALVVGAERSEAHVTLAERESRRIELAAPVRKVAPVVEPTEVAAAPSASVASATAPPGAVAPDTGAGRSTQATVGWVVTGLGAAGLVLGSITGGIALGDRSSLDESCVDGRCPPGLEEDVDSYNTMRMVSAVGLWGGLGLVAAGVIVVLTAPNDSEAPATAGQLAPWLGLGSAGIRGRF